MNTRPTSITVVSWILIVLGLFSLVTNIVSSDNPMAKDLMNRSAIPVPLQYIMLYFGLLVHVVSGIAMLKCKNWGRLLYTIWSVIGSAIVLVTFPVKTMLIPGFVFFVVIVFFLFRPKANDYFKRSHAEREPPIISNEAIRNANLKMSNIFSIASLVIAGYFVLSVCLLAFVKLGILKYVLIVVFSIPILAFSFFGIRLNRNRAWKKSVGLVFMWGAIATAFSILTLISVLASPDLRKMFPADSIALFSDYVAGTAITILFFIIGVGLQRLGNRQPAEQIAPGDAAHNAAQRPSSTLGKASTSAITTQGEIDIPNNPDEFYKAIVGPKNQDYYLSQFSRFNSNGKVNASWHWPAFFVTFYWFLYRKMWLNALIYFFLLHLVVIPLGIAGAVAGNSAPIVIGIGYVLFLIAIFLLPPMYANALYYKHCKKRITEASVSSQDLQRQLGELSGKGGTSIVALIFVLIFAFIAFVAFVGILAAIAIPAYQDYTTKAHMTEAVALGSNAADSVANYYHQHQEIPSSLEQAGFATPIPPAVEELSVNSENGTVIVTMANAPISGKTLLFVPSLDSNEKIVWTCMSQEIQDKYLPQQCRQ